MANDYREEEDVPAFDADADDDRVPDLDPGPLPASIGVYERPERKTGAGLSVASIIGILTLLVIAYFVLNALF